MYERLRQTWRSDPDAASELYKHARRHDDADLRLLVGPTVVNEAGPELWDLWGLAWRRDNAVAQKHCAEVTSWWLHEADLDEDERDRLIGWICETTDDFEICARAVLAHPDGFERLNREWPRLVQGRDLIPSVFWETMDVLERYNFRTQAMKIAAGVVMSPQPSHANVVAKAVEVSDTDELVSLLEQDEEALLSLILSATPWLFPSQDGLIGLEPAFFGGDLRPWATHQDCLQLVPMEAGYIFAPYIPVRIHPVPLHGPEDARPSTLPSDEELIDMYEDPLADIDRDFRPLIARMLHTADLQNDD